MRRYRKEKYPQHREKIINMLGGVCSSCGATSNLQVDHIDPDTKEFDPLAFPPKSKERIEKELAKCQLLCSDCHEIKSARDQGKKPAKGTHGTLSSYRHCKCRKCKDAWNKYHREYKRKRKNNTPQKHCSDAPAS